MTKDKSAGLWALRIKMNQQMVFSAITRMADNSDCPVLKKIARRQWFSGYDFNAVRMLPDGTTIPGAPYAVDLTLRSEIVSEVLDGLKQRPRPGSPEPRSLFKLELYEYDLLLAMCQAYEKAEEFTAQKDLDPYVASAFETMVHTMLHVARMDDETVTDALHRPLDEGDYDACTI